jgi:predicted CoA-binding protein
MLDDEALGAILRTSRRIAVVGLSPNPLRPSHEVAAYLQKAGYQIIPVNPNAAEVLGQRSVPDLRAAAANGPIDIVDVFRRPDALPALLDDCLRIRPRLVVLQVGVTNPSFAERLESERIPVLMDRCLKVDHHHLLGR